MWHHPPIRKATIDNLEIAYSDTGAGGLPLVCLTGWCSSRARYDLVAPLLAKRGRVITVDWRDHGDSSHTREDFGRNEMVRDVLAVVDDAGLNNFGIVSASHSGWVAIDVRRRLGARVPVLVHLDWLMFEPSESYMAVIRQLQSEEAWPGGRDTLFRVWRGGIENAA